MKKQLLILSTFCAVTGLWSCTKEEENGIKENNSNPPGLVSNVKVTNENGAATITYTMPADQDLLYVKAMYTLANGTKREVKASTYTNALRVDGFSDTLKHTVQLIAVNKSEVASAPVDVTVEPLVSPIQLVYRNLQVTATAGGIRIKSLNKFRGNVVIVPLMDSLSKGDFISLDNIYTSDSIIATSIRGLTPVQKKFAFFVRDRWLNTTDTLYLNLTPAKEVLLPRSGYSSFVCDNDTKMSFNTTVEMMWQGLLNNEWPCTYTDESSGVPTTITWSVGPQPVKLTRFNLLTRREGSLYYAKGSPRRFEVYGANEPTRDGDWSKWTKIQTFEVIKPSGLPLGQETSADAAAGASGFTFDFSEDTPKYRYLRIKCLQNWIGSYFIVIQNMNVWATE
ncbi:DUF5000 domain-containing lipoprotein [Paraflavitalea sp. CAU 1676]|uniref:DUF4959 domain-containing protein n=1 Tax=Paraflavitalea sp. CAU 1676 TaxID=3032598 RepID=UPI0023DC90B1|nr:DUF5000 domain-containing lipoprotein [Paraflavitalea sp. CAU 1676]MDF2188275.1 DUF5000 domain-containing lipoprotein [Paraflavitalea sp. CAU 1676]